MIAQAKIFYIIYQNIVLIDISKYTSKFCIYVSSQQMCKLFKAYQSKSTVASTMTARSNLKHIINLFKH